MSRDDPRSDNRLGGRPAVFGRALAVAIPIVLASGIVGAWLGARSDRLALADAADRTAATSARFAFEGRFSGRLDLSGFDLDLAHAARAVRRQGVRIARVLPQGLPDDVRSLLRARLRELGEIGGDLRIRSLARTEVAFRGQGELDRRDGARFEGTVEVSEPAEVEAAYEWMSWHNGSYVRLGQGPWRGAARLPSRILTPLEDGLDGLSALVGAGAAGAEALGPEAVGDVPAARYRLTAPAAVAAGFDPSIDVWVGDEDGLIHRLLFRRGSEGVVGMEGSLDVLLFDHRAEVRMPGVSEVEDAPGTGLPAAVETRLDELDRWLAAGR